MRRIFSPYHQASLNLAAEECLLTADATVFSPCLLLYVNRPSVVLGCNQSVSAEVDRDYCRRNGIGLARRISGGGAVFHDEGNLNFCFISEGRQKTDDDSFLAPVMEVLAQMGMPVELGRRKDLWTNGAKISGTASHFTKDRSLRHGTLLYSTDVQRLAGALLRHSASASAPSKGVLSVASPVTNLSAADSSGRSESATDFFERFSDLLGHRLDARPDSFSPEEQSEIEKLALEKYQSDSWIFRIP